MEPTPKAGGGAARTRLARLLRLFTAGDRMVAAAALLVVAYYCATRGIFQGKASGDGFFGFMYLPCLTFHHTLDIAPAVPYWAPILGREVTGHVANPCPIGPPLFWAPTYFIGLGLEKLAGMIVTLPPQKLPGQSEFDFWMAGLGSLAAGLLGVAVMFRLLARKLGVPAARFGALGATLATPLVWYFVTQPLYQHATAFLVVTVLVERWDAWRGDMTIRRWAALGAIAGAAMLMRLQEAIWILPAGLDALGGVIAGIRSRKWLEVRKFLVGGVVMAVVGALVFAPQVGAWLYYFGTVRPPQPAGHMRWGDPAIVASIFSMRAGLLPWSPILYLVLPGLLLGRKRLGALGSRMALMIVVELWVNASAWDYFGSWSYGARRYTDATVAFAAGLGGLWAWLGERGPALRVWGRRAAAGSAVVAVAYNGLLMELVRQGKVKSSGSMAAPASTWIKWAKGPEWLGKFFDKVGYPFCQPAGWIYAIAYRAPVNTFEGVVGSHLLERDSRIHGVVMNGGFSFADPGWYVVEGIAGPPVGKGAAAAVPVAKRVRVVVPLFAREPIRVALTGDFGGREGAVGVTWNGEKMATRTGKERVAWEVAKELTHSRSRANMLEIEVPDGAMLRKLDFESTSTWYR